MAYSLKNISPLDLKPSTAIGVKLPFSSPSVFSSVYTTKEQTKYNIINFLLTDKRERPFNPNFGAGLRSTLFEQINSITLDSLKISLQSQIESNFPNIEITELNINSDPNNSYITIQFTYKLLNTSEIDTAVIAIQNV
jgi:phage baseplate assembly protein W